MTFEEIPCRWCGMKFTNLKERAEHEACHTDLMPSQEIDVDYRVEMEEE